MEQQLTGNSLAETLSKVNSGVATAIGVLSLVKTIRDMAKAAHPDAPDGTFPSDEELISELASKSGLLKTEVNDFREWLKTQGPTATEPSTPAPQQ